MYPNYVLLGQMASQRSKAMIREAEVDHLLAKLETPHGKALPNLWRTLERLLGRIPLVFARRAQPIHMQQTLLAPK